MAIIPGLAGAEETFGHIQPPTAARYGSAAILDVDDGHRTWRLLLLSRLGRGVLLQGSETIIQELLAPA